MGVSGKIAPLCSCSSSIYLSSILAESKGVVFYSCDITTSVAITLSWIPLEEDLFISLMSLSYPDYYSCTGCSLVSKEFSLEAIGVYSADEALSASFRDTFLAPKLFPLDFFL